MPQPKQGPDHETWGHVEQLVGVIIDKTPRLQLEPAPSKPARRKRDLGARLRSILVGRFQAHGLPAREAEIQADLCLGLSGEGELFAPARSRCKVVAIR